MSMYDEDFEEDYEQEYYDPNEDIDWERETYYALGGDDYDEFKENGGDLDCMMEGMGF